MTLQSMSEGAVIRDMVDEIIHGLQTSGHTILFADHPEHPSVREVNGRTPDIVSRNDDGVRIVTAVETALTVGSLPTRDRLRAFSAARDERTRLHVAVPESCLGYARDLAHEWDVEVDAWWSDNRF
jgi:hypothetical protein